MRRKAITPQRSKHMTLVEEPKLYDMFAPEALLGPYTLCNQMSAEDLMHFAEPYAFWVRNGMVTYERIAAAAAELARQFWLEIDAEFTRQTARCQADWPARDAHSVDRPDAAYARSATHAPMEAHDVDTR
jgi:thiamine biosynthesis protein ThiC